MGVQECAVAGVDGFDSAEFGHWVFLAFCFLASAIPSSAGLDEPGEFFRTGRLGTLVSCDRLCLVAAFDSRSGASVFAGDAPCAQRRKNQRPGRNYCTQAERGARYPPGLSGLGHLDSAALFGYPCFV